MKFCRQCLMLVVLIACGQRAGAQVVIGVRGTTSQPALVVFAGPGLDSVRAIVQRDLQFSDRFTVAPLADSLATLKAPLDANAVRSLGVTWAVELQRGGAGVQVKLYDVSAGTLRHDETRPADLSGIGDSRITIHRISDLVVGWTGGTGFAATRIAYKAKNGSEDAIWRIDSDGANRVRVTSAGPGIYMTPAWSPDGASIAYSENLDGRWWLYIQKLGSGNRTALTGSSPTDSYGGNFSPDGKFMVYAHVSSGGVAIEKAEIPRNCCAQMLTTDRRNADNVSPSYSPDGRHIAYISNRTGSTQVWVMDEDGTSPDQLIATEVNGAGRQVPSYSPVWSPDQTHIAFARDVENGVRQIFLASVSGGQVQQLTSVGQNEDPSWAPDSRHLVLKSKRSGREQLWVFDIESRSMRQLATTPGGAQFPAWSHILGTNP